MAYKTPAELQITQTEHDLLTKCVPILRRMKAKTVTPIEGDGTFAFNMNWMARKGPEVVYTRGWEHFGHCDTVGCIAGLCEILAVRDGVCFEVSRSYRSYSKTLCHLFYPRSGINYEKVTPRQAAKMIKWFLEGNDPHKYPFPKAYWC